jgi:curved DNA-binding protein CbpA
MLRPVVRAAKASAPEVSKPGPVLELRSNGIPALMKDYFALLVEPRRPWLDADALKVKFHTLSSEAHPDRVHSASGAEKQAANERYAELNAAYNCLREPKDRLRHLLELELGGKPGGVERVPEDAMELFTRVGPLYREVDNFLTERSKVTAPLLKVQMFQRGMDWTDKLQSLLKTLQVCVADLETDLRSMNPVWESAPPLGDARRSASLPLGQLEQTYRALSYFSRWTDQLNERIVQLSL